MQNTKVEIPILDVLSRVRTLLQEAKKQADPSIFLGLTLSPLEIESLGAFRNNLECLEVLTDKAIRTIGSIIYVYRIIEKEKPLDTIKKIKGKKKKL